MSIDGMARRLDRAIEQAGGEPPENFLAGKEWPPMKETIMHCAKPFPESEQALRDTFAFLEQAGPLAWEIVRETICRAIERDGPARIAIASGLSLLER